MSVQRTDILWHKDFVLEYYKYKYNKIVEWGIDSYVISLSCHIGT